VFEGRLTRRFQPRPRVWSNRTTAGWCGRSTASSNAGQSPTRRRPARAPG